MQRIALFRNRESKDGAEIAEIRAKWAKRDRWCGGFRLRDNSSVVSGMSLCFLIREAREGVVIPGLRLMCGVEEPGEPGDGGPEIGG